MWNDKSVHSDACLGLGSRRVPRLVVTSRDDELFSLSRYSSEIRAVETTAPGTGLPRRSHALRRDAVGQRVGMKIGVITQTEPGTIWLGGLCYGVFFTRRKVVP